MRRILLPALAAALAALAAASLAGVGRPDAAHGAAPSSGTVTTVGHGVVTLAPDEATVTAGVHTQAATAADALGRNAERMAAVVAALRDAGGRALQTQQVSLYPQAADDGSVTGYVADNSVSSTIAVAKAGALIDAAVAAGANTVSGPTLSVSDRTAHYREALAQAVADARGKAEALAKAGGFAVGTVSAVVEQPAAVPQPLYAAAAARVDATPVEAGTQEVAADVTVTFRIA